MKERQEDDHHHYSKLESRLKVFILSHAIIISLSIREKHPLAREREEEQGVGLHTKRDTRVMVVTKISD